MQEIYIQGIFRFHYIETAAKLDSTPGPSLVNVVYEEIGAKKTCKALKGYINQFFG